MTSTPRGIPIRMAAIIALVAFPATRALGEHANNLILFVPEALSAASVDHISAPALSRLRHEGVSFINSHSGFPRLETAEPGEPTSDLNAETLLAAATERYATAFVYDTRSDTAPNALTRAAVSEAVKTSVLVPAVEQSTPLERLVNVTLPRFKQANRPFFLIYRLAEPPYKPPALNDARPAYTPSARAADDALAAIEAALKQLELHETTNIVVAAEHGLSRILKVSDTSRARSLIDKDDSTGVLPPGFLAVDVMAALSNELPGLSLFDADLGSANVDWESGGHPVRGNAHIGVDPTQPFVRIEAHGVHDAIFISERLPKPLVNGIAQVIAEGLFEQDYLGALFVNEKRVGRVNGALSLKHIAPDSPAGVRLPDMLVTFVAMSTGCGRPTLCSAVIADTPVEEGAPIHASFSRAGTWTFLAARGPDFQREVISQTPASGADVARTIAELLHLEVQPLKGSGLGRVLAEGLRGYESRGLPRSRKQVVASAPSVEGLITQVHLQSAGARNYFDGVNSADVPTDQRVVQAERHRPRWHWPKFKRFTIEISPDD